MKILFISSMLLKKSSSASIRNLSLVNGLAELGFEITVITIQYPSEVIDDYLKAILNPRVKLISVHAGLISNYIPNVNSKISTRNTLLQWLKKHVKSFVYFPDIDKKWITKTPYNQVKGYDILISSSDTKTSHFIASIIKKQTRKKWIQIWGDPWYSDVHNHHLIYKIRSKVSERKLLKEADKIIYVSKPTLDHMQKEYSFIKNKSHHVPRGYLKAITGPPPCNENTINICYTGVLRGRNIHPLVSRLTSYNKMNKIQISINVYGRIPKDIKQEFNNFSCIKFCGEKTMEEIFNIYSKSDILLFIGNKAHSTQIPGKLYDYFGTNRPILALLEDIEEPVAQFIKQTNRCIIFENKIDQIQVEELIKKTSIQQIQEEYSPKSIANKILDLI